MRVKLVRSPKNPIIEPKSEMAWKNRATFNPGAVKSGEITHILYRAVNERSISSLGYATTADSETILDRSEEPVFSPTEPWEELGCEDPRITGIDGTFYIFYTAYSRRGPRIAAASTTDFRNYIRYGVVGPDYDDKDCALFPERIDGKFAAAHRIAPNIEIAFFESIQRINNRDSQNPYSKNSLKRIQANIIMKPEKESGKRRKSESVHRRFELTLDG